MARILLLDDDIAEITAVKRLVARTAHRAQLATTAADASGAIERDPPDLLVVASGCDGGQALAVVREAAARDVTSALPVIVLGDAAGLSGPVRALPLPFDPEQLAREIERLLAASSGVTAAPASGAAQVARIAPAAPPARSRASGAAEALRARASALRDGAEPARRAIATPRPGVEPPRPGAAPSRPADPLRASAAASVSARDDAAEDPRGWADELAETGPALEGQEGLEPDTGASTVAAQAAEVRRDAEAAAARRAPAERRERPMSRPRAEEQERRRGETDEEERLRAAIASARAELEVMRRRQAPTAQATGAAGPSRRPSPPSRPSSERPESPTVAPPVTAKPGAQAPMAPRPVAPEAVASEPITTETARPEPIPAPPAAPEPIVSEPITTEPASAAPISAPPAGPGTVSEPAAAEPVAPTPVAARPAAPGTIASEPIATEPARPEPIPAPPAAPEPIASASLAPEAAPPDPPHPASSTSAPSTPPATAAPGLAPLSSPLPSRAPMPPAAFAAGASLASPAPPRVTPPPVPSLPPPPEELRAGTLAELPAPRLLALAAQARLAGRLDLEGDVARSLWFEGGRVVGATSGDPAERIEALAVRFGLVTRDQHQQVAAQAASLPARRAALLLLDAGFLKPAELGGLVRRRTEEVVFGIFGDAGARFRWVADEVPADERGAVERPPLALAVEGVRRRWSAPRLDPVLGGPDTLLTSAPEGPPADALALSPEERQVVALVDGLRTVHEVERASPLDALATRQVLVALVHVGALAVGRLAMRASPEASREIDLARLADKLDQARRCDYFTVLGLSRSSTSHEVREAAARLEEALAPGRLAGPPGETLARLGELLQVVRDAREVLGDDRLRQAYLSALD